MLGFLVLIRAETAAAVGKGNAFLPKFRLVAENTPLTWGNANIGPNG